VSDKAGASPGRVRRHRDTLQRYFQVHFDDSTLDVSASAAT